MKLRLFAIATVAWLVTTVPAAAGEDADREATQHRSSEILAHIDRPTNEEGWFALHLDRIHVHKQTGLAYSSRIAVGDRDLRFSLRGPALGSKKRVGLSVEIDF